ncbi:MAG: response regulator transcription factor [Oscillochloris sp.]|nr:response regulator transcription factor [Oscillochloris sp.]
MATRILIVDDDPLSQTFLSRCLDRTGYLPVCAERGSVALDLVRAHTPDLVLLDLLLPDIDGCAVCRAIRAESAVPILVISALGDEAHEVALFAAGADDYLIKPPRPAELLARIRRALVRSTTAAPPTPTVYHVGGLHVDMAAHHAWSTTTRLALTPSEWTLLCLLIPTPNQLCCTETLCAQLWPGDPDRTGVALHAVVQRLRHKLAGAARIENVRGVGYRLVAESP